MWLNVFMFLFAFLICIVRLFYFHHFFKISGMTFLEGIASFFAVNLIGSFFNVHLPINWLTTSLVLLGGTPAAIFLLLTQILFHL